MSHRTPCARGIQVTQYGTRGIAWLSLVLLCACAPNIAVDYDKSTDFSRYRSYGWGKGTPAKTPGLDRQIVKAIDEQLDRKGLSKTDNDPDLVVTYHAATHEEIDYNEASYGSLWLTHKRLFCRRADDRQSRDGCGGHVRYKKEAQRLAWRRKRSCSG
jgi:hypothetical protein